MFTLIQFPYSHFCAKARWALDVKAQPYQVENLLPVAHIWRTRRLGLATSLPILLHDAQPIQGSGAIIDYLDATFPAAPLTPSDPQQAQAAREWEQFADQEIGVHLRRWLYVHILPHRRLALGIWQTGATPGQKAVLSLCFPLLRGLMRKSLNITPAKGEASRLRLEAALDRLDQALATQRYLVGEQFTRADLAVCALLGPLLGVGQTEESLAQRMPAAVLAWRQQQSQRRCFAWAQAIHAQHHPAAARA